MIFFFSKLYLFTIVYLFFSCIYIFWYIYVYGYIYICYICNVAIKYLHNKLEIVTYKVIGDNYEQKKKEAVIVMNPIFNIHNNKLTNFYNICIITNKITP